MEQAAAWLNPTYHAIINDVEAPRIKGMRPETAARFRGLGRAAQSLQYGLRGYDPGVIAAAALSLTMVAFAAGFLPALKASRVDPMQALRYE